MRKATRFTLALALGMGLIPGQAEARAMASSGEPDDSAKPAKARLQPMAATAADVTFSDYEFDAEQQLLVLANQDRAKAGARPLTLDAGLSQAARTHAIAMFEARQISHRFDGEPSLPQRLAAATRLQLDQEAENVALDYDAPHAQQHLMLSPPHRANLLNPAYNVVGLGVVRSGGRLYVVQDFGHALPGFSAIEVKDRVAAAVNQMRHDARKPDLPRQDLVSADDAACSMAQADSLATSPIHQLALRYNVLTFTSLHPEVLPGSATHVITGPNLRSFSVGACYGRTETYPTGVYWVVLVID